ncbi:uncharacterized protein ACN427_000606 [Glossina fuscipes fuscipes]
MLKRNGVCGVSTAQPIVAAKQDVELTADALKNLMPTLDQLMKEQRLSVERANKIIADRLMPLVLANYLGLTTMSSGHEYLQPQQMFSFSVSPLSLPNSTSNSNNQGGCDKSLGFSDDSLSNDSNNLSPCQEPSASSGFKSDSHSEIGDPTEGHLTPDSLSELRRMSDEMCYEVPLPHECSNLETRRILEIVKQTIDSTMPPKGFILHKRQTNEAMDGTSVESAINGSRPDTRLSIASDSSHVCSVMDTGQALTNLSLEYSGGLQIEVQVCEGRSRDNQIAGKGIKLRRISGDQFEYGKLCQQLISNLSMQQVAG